VDARPGYEPVVGAYAVVGDEGADPKVARILSIDERGIIELEVLPGSVEAHRDRLTPARPRSDLLQLLLLCGTKQEATQQYGQVGPMRETAAQRYWTTCRGTDQQARRWAP
jgi:hypothetical protein